MRSDTTGRVWFDKAEKFPPPPGEWVRIGSGGIMLCCPKCFAVAGPLTSPPHVVGKDGVLEPSFLCPSGCQYHVMLGLEGFKIEEGTCPTCGHAEHEGRPCVVGEKPCHCMAGTRLGTVTILPDAFSIVAADNGVILCIGNVGAPFEDEQVKELGEVLIELHKRLQARKLIQVAR